MLVTDLSVIQRFHLGILSCYLINFLERIDELLNKSSTPNSLGLKRAVCFKNAVLIHQFFKNNYFTIELVLQASFICEFRGVGCITIYWILKCLSTSISQKYC